LLGGNGRAAFDFSQYTDGAGQIMAAVVVVGTEPVSLSQIKLGPSGSWVHSYGGPGYEFTQFFKTVGGPTVRMYLGATSESFNGENRGGLALKLDDDGGVNYARSLRVPGLDLNPRAWALSPGQNLAMAGDFRHPDSGDPETDVQVPAVLLLSEDGNLLWSRSIEVLGFNYVKSVAATPDRVFLSFTYDGFGNGGGNDDAMVAVFDMSGALLACKRVDTGEHNSAPELLRNPEDNKVYAQFSGSLESVTTTNRIEILPDGSLGTPAAIPLGNSFGSNGQQSDATTVDVGDYGNLGAVWLNNDGTVKWATQLDLAFTGNGWFSRISGNRLYLAGRSTTIWGETAVLAIFDDSGSRIDLLAWSEGGESYNMDVDQYGSVYTVIEGEADNRGKWIRHASTPSSFVPEYLAGDPLDLTVTDFAITPADLAGQLLVENASPLTIDTGGGDSDVVVVKTDVLDTLGGGGDD
jgi:hypothetical protein